VFERESLTNNQTGMAAPQRRKRTKRGSVPLYAWKRLQMKRNDAEEYNHEFREFRGAN